MPETGTQGFSGHGQLVTLLLKMKRYMTIHSICNASIFLTTSSLTNGLFKGVLLNFQIFRNFLYFFFISSAIPFWLGNILYMTFNIFNVLRLVLSYIIRSILVNAPFAGEKNVCSAVAG